MISKLDKIKIGYREFEILYEEPGDNFVGLTSSDEEWIKIKPGMSKKYTELTLLHEIMHGILYSTGIEAYLITKNIEDLKELICDGVAEHIMQILRDNDLEIVRKHSDRKEEVIGPVGRLVVDSNNIVVKTPVISIGKSEIKFVPKLISSMFQEGKEKELAVYVDGYPEEALYFHIKNGEIVRKE